MPLEIPRLGDLPLQGKRVLVRVDFNVPLDAKGEITDTTRIKAALPTIEYLLEQEAKIVLMSHLGRPKAIDPKYSLKNVAKALSAILKRPVAFAPDCIGPQTTQQVNSLKPGEILLLENLRYYPAEEDPDKDPSFANKLASLADYYVNDAFGCAHRPHTSVASIVKFFPKKAAQGFLMEKEVSYLQSTLAKPERPFFALLGGAKISTKIGVIETLLNKVDALFIGGAMVYTFMKAMHLPIGNSLFEPDFVQTAAHILEKAKINQIPLYLPIDLVVSESISSQSVSQVVSLMDGIPTGFQGVDIGPKTIRDFSAKLHPAKTVFWNGPFGVFETPPFNEGTLAIAKTLATLPAITIVGGGDSVAAIQQAGLGSHFKHLSTGGGASLELIELGTLPGIEALKTSVNAEGGIPVPF